MDLKNLLVNPRPWDYPGCFIVIDGPDGAGKDTQVDQLMGWVQKGTGRVPRRIQDPGTSALGLVLRKVLKDGELSLSPEEQILLFTAARLATAREILPDLKAGKVVIGTRWVLSTLVYQSDAPNYKTWHVPDRMPTRTKEELILRLQEEMIGLVPDVTIVLNGTRAGLAERLTRRTSIPGEAKLDHLEADAEINAQRAVAFTERTRACGCGRLLVDASLPPYDAAEAVRVILRENAKLMGLMANGT